MGLVVAGLRPLMRFKGPQSVNFAAEQGWNRVDCVPCRYGKGIFYMEGTSWIIDRH